MRGLRDGGACSVTAIVVRHLEGSDALLVLDNVEHVVDAAEDIACLLAGSRPAGPRDDAGPLRLTGERLVSIATYPLTHGPTVPSTLRKPSVRSGGTDRGRSPSV